MQPRSCAYEFPNWTINKFFRYCISIFSPYNFFIKNHLIFPPSSNWKVMLSYVAAWHQYPFLCMHDKGWKDLLFVQILKLQYERRQHCLDKHLPAAREIFCRLAKLKREWTFNYKFSSSSRLDEITEIKHREKMDMIDYKGIYYRIF